MQEKVQRQQWAFGGIPREEWGTEEAVHKERPYPRVLLTAMGSVRKECLEFLAQHLGEDQAFFHEWLTEEMLLNAMTHGNGYNPECIVEVEIVITETADHTVRKVFAVFHTTDEGEFFNPADVPNPTDEEMLENPTGRGVHVTAQLAERFYGHKATMSVDASVWPANKESGKRVTFQWYREIPVASEN